MHNIYKYILLYVISAIIAFGLTGVIDDWHNESVNTQKNILLKEAKTLYQNQLNTRKWNSMYNGVYVKPLKNQKPNKYLDNPTLKVNDKLTLIKINPAWMSRQLSELSNIKNFSFRITGLDPINPENTPSAFEKKAIEKFKNKDLKEYYEISSDGKLNYMGATKVSKSCISCHPKYVLGEVNGGISVSLKSNEYTTIMESLNNKTILAKLGIVLFLSIIILLIREQLKHNEQLSYEIDNKTKELVSTKSLLQSILDADKSFLLVSDGKDMIFANKTILDFVGFNSLEDFENNNIRISDFFEEVDDENFLKADQDGVHWIAYLIQEQNNKKLKVLTKKDKELIYFKPHTKEIVVNEQTLYLITFDNITHEYTTIEKFKTEASTDPLTGLFNRRKLNNVLEKEISISDETSSPLSIIFLDIDHFKVVNDTLGHDVGDVVLKELAKIITSTVRSADFVARWGGEEFMIALQFTDVNAASKIAEKLRIKVEEYNFTDAGKITISLGVTQFKENENEDSFTKRVDNALYEAKDSGRNKVVSK